MRVSRRILWLILATAVSAPADEVRLKNGDRLTGTLVRMEDETVVFRSDLLGELKIPRASVVGLTVPSPLEIRRKDGTTIRGPIRTVEPGRFAAGTEGREAFGTFVLDDLVSINVPPVVWEGNLSAGFTVTSGNTSTEAMNASATLGRRSERDRTTIDADLTRGKQKDADSGEKKTTEDWRRAKAQYDYFFTKKNFAFLNGQFERDDVANLDRRVIFGGGIGYQWRETDRTKLSTTLGLASRYEKYEEEGSGDTELTLQAAYRFEGRLSPHARLLHDLMYYPVLEDFADFYLSASLTLRAKFTEKVFLDFKVILNHDATPAEDQLRTDVKYTLGLGMGF